MSQTIGIKQDVYQIILDSAIEGILIAEIESKNFIYANKSICKMLGYEKNEILTCNVSDIHPEKNLADIIKTFEAQARGEFELAFEIPCLRKNGTIFWADINTSKTIINGVACNVEFFSDVTERKSVRNKIEKMKIDFEKTIKRSPAHVFRFKKYADMNYKAVLSEGIIAEIFGITTNIIKGKYLNELFNPEDYKQIKKYYDQAFHGEKVSFEIFIRGKWFRTSIAPYEKSDKGDVIEIIGYTTDISELKSVRDQLEKSQKLESLGLLAGGIAHDFNNLLGGIFGNIDMAREVSSETEVQNYLNLSLNTINRARSLTKQFLTFSKGGTPKRKTQKLNQFICDTVKFALSGSNVSCQYTIDENLWLCDFDKSQIAQVIDNIVINAQQAMPLGGRIDLVAENIILDKDEHLTISVGKYVKISIKDKGIGIPHKILHKIFDPFFTTKQKGSGLGLATSYSILKKHAGHIDVESTPGQGTTFIIWMPASKAGKNHRKKSHKPDLKKIGKILIMDDEDVMRETMTQMLTKAGYETVSTKDGKEALNEFTEKMKNGKKFDIVILDLTVPGGLGGKETIMDFRKLDKNIPVIVISGYSEDPIIQSPKDYGFTDSIKKPFVKHEMISLISKHI